jgi:hypothetical protein
VPPLDIFGTEPIFHRRSLQTTNMNGINIRHQLHPYFSPDPKKPRLIAKLVVSLHFFLTSPGFQKPTFSYEKWFLFAVFLPLHIMFHPKGPKTG